MVVSNCLRHTVVCYNKGKETDTLMCHMGAHLKALVISRGAMGSKLVFLKNCLNVLRHRIVYHINLNMVAFHGTFPFHLWGLIFCLEDMCGLIFFTTKRLMVDGHHYAWDKLWYVCVCGVVAAACKAAGAGYALDSRHNSRSSVRKLCKQNTIRAGRPSDFPSCNPILHGWWPPLCPR